MSKIVETPPPFDPNEGLTPDGQHSTLMLPSDIDATLNGHEPLIRTGAEYISRLEISNIPETTAIEKELVKSADSKIPPSTVNAGRLMFAADAMYAGVIDWPGLTPPTLRMIARQNVAPQMIIGMRCADVLRYSDLSKQAWKPGWRIELIAGSKSPDEQELKEILEAETFLANSCIGLPLDKAVERDATHLSSFASFLDAITRDTLTYAAIALWKDTDRSGKVKSFAALPAGNIRLTGMKNSSGHFQIGGFDGDPNIATVLVGDANNIVSRFTRDELTFYIRNPRTDVDIYGYGYPEIEMAHRVIAGFQNALEMNTDTFTRSAIPNGILVLKGGQVTQKQLDLLNRIWTNLKKGVSKSWALPVIGLSADSEIEVIDLSRMKGNEGYYKEYTNMLAGMLCTLWKFPVRRLGYKASGQGHDSEPLPESQTNKTDADDPGLAPLLMHLEGLINQYLLWTRWPHLRFTFSGKTPDEDARSYEARRNAMTLQEARAEADLMSVEDLAEGEDEEVAFIAKLMDFCPIDPGLAGVYQSMAAAAITAKFAPEPTAAAGATPGARMTASKDPAKSATHGKRSGVRRDSKAESAKK